MPALAWLWVKMGDRHGHAFTSQYGTDPAGKSAETWAEDLAGLTDEQIRFGFDECLKLGGDWPPSSSRFRMLCLNIPTIAHVRQEFKNTDGAHRSPFARKLWQFIDSYQFGRADQDKADRMFRDAYDLTREHVMNGGELPAPAAAQLVNEAPAAPKPASEDVAKKHIDEIMGFLKGGESAPVRPKAVTVNQYADAASNRYIVRVILDNGKTISLPSFDGLTPPTHIAVQEAIAKEIDRLMEVENAV